MKIDYNELKYILQIPKCFNDSIIIKQLVKTCF